MGVFMSMAEISIHLGKCLFSEKEKWSLCADLILAYGMRENRVVSGIAWLCSIQAENGQEPMVGVDED